MTNAEFIEGVAILGKYLAPDGFGIRAEHDQIWIGGDAPLTAEDRARLEELDWFYCREGNGWSCNT